MATTEELLAAYAEWRTRSNGNSRLTKMVKGWDRVIHFVTTDTEQRYTMRIEAQRLTELEVGHVGQPDVIVTGSSEDFCDMFWGDLNPSDRCTGPARRRRRSGAATSTARCPPGTAPATRCCAR